MASLAVEKYNSLTGKNYEVETGISLDKTAFEIRMVKGGLCHVTVGFRTIERRHRYYMNAHVRSSQFYDASGRPEQVVYDGAAYWYVTNQQGDVVALVDDTGAVAVSYTYDAWGRPTGKTGTLASTLGTVQPFRYRGYVWDEETGLYYLRSRYYRAEWCRFVNADGFIKGNLYSYCNDSPTITSDDDGYDCLIHTGLWYPDVYFPITANRFGEHSADEKMPLDYLISALVQMSNDPFRDGKKWGYSPTLKYGSIDCNGLLRMVFKSFYSRKAYRSFNIGYKVSTVVNALGNGIPIPIKDHNVPAGCILISKIFHIWR